MKQMPLLFLLTLLLISFPAGCGRKKNNSHKTAPPNITINGVSYPIYKNSELLQNAGIIITFHTDADPLNVRQWYDTKMKAEGWTDNGGWDMLGGTFQKSFTSAKDKHKIVRITTGKDKKRGGTHYSIIPIIFPKTK